MRILYVCILMHIKLHLTHILSQSLHQFVGLCMDSQKMKTEKDNATTSMEKAPKPQGKGDQIIQSDKEYK